MHQPAAHILIVEDEEIIGMIFENALVQHGYHVTLVKDGQAAWELLASASHTFETILLDRMMPRMDGMELLRNLKGSLALNQIPVIMETSVGDLQSVREGIEEGAYYYLTKPFQTELLLSVVHAAVQQYRDQQQLLAIARSEAERPLDYLKQGTFQFRTLDESRTLASFFARACPEPAKVALGLQELLINAVEHGNLGISYAEKTQLLLQDRWQQEVERRLDLPEYAERKVDVEFERDRGGIRFSIRDQGEGFDWRRFLDFDPERAFDPHGRGIAMARQMSFDSLEYRGNGNTVVAVVKAGDNS
jgi:DNA-binding response OmpR family regulator/anti-sigma regulatory factor (Ser/Thr protein kinase)